MDRLVKPRLLFLTCSVLAVLSGFCFYYFKPRQTTAHRKVTLAYRFSIENTSNKPLHHVTIGLFSPSKEHSYHRSVSLEANYPHAVFLDKAGNHRTDFHWDVIPPYSSKIVSIKNTLQIWEQPRNREHEDLKACLQPEPFIESDDKTIIALSKSLQKGSVPDTARQIFDWVSQNIAYCGYVKQSRGALYALNHRKGDCTEYATLFVALCRAAGIPARAVGGFACPQNMVVHLTDYHNWAEFHCDDRWHLADPQEKVFMRNEKYYVVFKTMQTALDKQAFQLFRLTDKAIKIKFNQ